MLFRTASVPLAVRKRNDLWRGYALVVAGLDLQQQPAAFLRRHGVRAHRSADAMISGNGNTTI